VKPAWNFFTAEEDFIGHEKLAAPFDGAQGDRQAKGAKN
jgi:hypothetical protein